MYNTMVFRGYSGLKEHLKKCPKGSLIYNYLKSGIVTNRYRLADELKIHHITAIKWVDYFDELGLLEKVESIVNAKNFILKKDKIEELKWNDIPQKTLYKAEIERKKKAQHLKKRFRILKKFNFTCQSYGRKAPEVKLHVDHKNPLSKGGSSKESNLIVACSDYNNGKSDVLLF